MKIKWNKDVEIEVCDHYDEENDAGFFVDESFKLGTIVDVDILARREDNTDMQFGDGSVAFVVENSCFDEVPNEDD